MNIHESSVRITGVLIRLLMNILFVLLLTLSCSGRIRCSLNSESEIIDIAMKYYDVFDVRCSYSPAPEEITSRSEASMSEVDDISYHPATASFISDTLNIILA